MWKNFLMRDISFYLIHNNSKDRLELRNEIKSISNNFNIELIEISKQRKSSKRNCGIWHKLKILNIYFFRTYYDLIHKQEFSLDFYILFLKSLSNLITLSIKLIFKNNNAIINTHNHLEIESLVTRKHIQAWEHFLKSKKKIMTIFEDDAICKKDTEERLKQLFNLLKTNDFEKNFIDLAGGYSQKNVIPKTKIKNSNKDFLTVKGIYTNTACCYLINRNLVNELYNEYQKSKSNNTFPIDHLINKLGLKIKNPHNIFSIHFHNPLFTHGSFKGNIKSWQHY